MHNTIKKKPIYTHHRIKQSSPPGSAVPVDSATLSALDTRAALFSNRWDTLDGFVILTGGTAPTVALVPLEVVEYEDNAGAWHLEYKIAGPAIGPLSSDQKFSFSPYGSRVFFRIAAVTGDPTRVEILVAGVGATA